LWAPNNNPCKDNRFSPNSRPTRIAGIDIKIDRAVEMAMRTAIDDTKNEKAAGIIAPRPPGANLFRLWKYSIRQPR
jgi:hypothetical protein